MTLSSQGGSDFTRRHRLCQGHLRCPRRRQARQVLAHHVRHRPVGCHYWPAGRNVDVPQLRQEGRH